MWHHCQNIVLAKMFKIMNLNNYGKPGKQFHEWYRLETFLLIQYCVNMCSFKEVSVKLKDDLKTFTLCNKLFYFFRHFKRKDLILMHMCLIQVMLKKEDLQFVSV